MPVLSLNISMTAADKADVITKIGEIKALMPYLINLTPTERQRLRKKGTKHEGYVQDVFSAIKNNPTVVPSTFSFTSYETDMNANTDLKDVLDQMVPLYEGISDTLLLLGNELMKQSDSGYDYLKRASKDNAALQAIVEEIAKSFKRRSSPAKPPTP